MSASNKVSTNIETEKRELEETTNKKLDEFKTEIKADNTTTCNSLYMKLSSLTSNNLTIPKNNISLISSNGHHSSHLKNLHMHHNLPSIYLPRTSKEKQFFIFKNDRITSLLPPTNTFQQTRSGHHKNILYQTIMNYLTLSCHWTPIINYLKQKQYEAFYRALRVHLVKDKNIP